MHTRIIQYVYTPTIVNELNSIAPSTLTHTHTHKRAANRESTTGRTNTTCIMRVNASRTNRSRSRSQFDRVIVNIQNAIG